jgi:hypothetical protein
MTESACTPVWSIGPQEGITLPELCSLHSQLSSGRRPRTGHYPATKKCLDSEAATKLDYEESPEEGVLT